MKAYTNCQSCGVPLDDASLFGTEKDGATNRLYCKYCYRDGHFTQPNITLEQMRAHLLQVMKQRKMPDLQIVAHLEGLASLRRWRPVSSGSGN